MKVAQIEYTGKITYVSPIIWPDGSQKTPIDYIRSMSLPPSLLLSLYPFANTSLVFFEHSYHTSAHGSSKEDVFLPLHHPPRYRGLARFHLRCSSALAEPDPQNEVPRNPHLEHHWRR